MKLIVKYSDSGFTTPDLKVQKWLEDLLGQLNNPSESNHNFIAIEIGSEVMINAIRVAIKHEQLKHEDVIMQFKDQEWKLDKDGRFKKWPDGFCDVNINYLEQLVGW